MLTERLVWTAIVFGLTASTVHGGGPTGGACCFADLSCAETVDAAECSAQGGVFLAGAMCADNPCDAGACCSDVGCGETDAFSCIIAGRDFLGAGTSCLDDPCEIGFGACCLVEACQVLSVDDCADIGGTWVGPGTLCDDAPCAAGGCCLEQACLDLRRFECDDQGGVFFEALDCAKDPCTPPNDCPENTLFAQQRDDRDDFLAVTSEASAGFRRFENFSAVAGPIEAVTFWGLDLVFVDGSWIECAESDPTFRVSFHADAAGEPGGAIESFIVTATRTPQGIFYLGSEMNEYSLVLPQPVVLVNGWISIVGLGDPDCWFLWMSAGQGSSFCTGCIAEIEDVDLSLCLQGTAGGVFGACCIDATGVCTDGVEITSCLGSDERFVPDTLCADLDPPCGVILGACCFDDATCLEVEEDECTALAGSWLGGTSICAQCPCITPCPEGGTDEGEPVCDDGYVDLFNGGCTASTPLFSPIEAGETVCGTGGIYVGAAEEETDFDWYEIEVTAASELRLDARAEYRGQVWIVDGTRGCPGDVLATTAGLECDDLSIATDVGPGTYWLVIAANAFSDSSGCGAAYRLTATVIVSCPADLDGDDMVGFADLLLILSNWGPCPGCPEDLDGDDVVGFGDLLLVLSTWGPCP